MGTSVDGGQRPSTRGIPVLGVFFILAGLALLFRSSLPVDLARRLWPLLLLIPVAAFAQQLLDRGREAAGVLVPGGVLLYLCAYFLWLNFTSWQNTATTWPNFLLAPALGLFLLFLATRRASLLLPVLVLSVLAGLFFGGMQRPSVALAAVLIVAGAAMVLGALRRRRG